MEKHLGFIVGTVGTLLLVAMVPLMAAMNTQGNTERASQGSMKGQTSLTADGAVAPASAQLTPDARLGSTSKSRNVRSNFDMTGDKVRAVTKLATTRVGGGEVIHIEPQSTASQRVWNVQIQQPNAVWQVKVSLSDYSVVQVDKLRSTGVIF